LRRAETRTADGCPIALHVNADSADEIAAARRLGAAGVGLFRSEMLYLRGTGVPSEDQQFRAYRDAVLATGGRPVVLRSLDLGADKASQAGLDLRHEDNPALGLRGIRYSLAHPDFFATQLRAMLRASAYGPVRVLLPMLTDPSQARATRVLMENCRAELEREHVALAEHVPLGGMIETPAAALDIVALLRELDFIAIGTNDLTQYTMAADRNHAALAAIYNPLHPAVLRLIAASVDAARRARKPVMLCGELAADARSLPVVLALGFTELSVHPDAILEVREALLLHSRKALRARRARMLAARNADEVFATLAP
jgi:phosphotransferase system enzyme I (PtsI)